MKVERVLELLEAAASARHRDVYLRHGVREPLFGVSYEDRCELARRIGIDHDLALALWSTGNHDARLLATMVADPDAVTGALLDAWQVHLDNQVLTDALVVLVSRAPVAPSRMQRWTRSSDEWIARAGWLLLARLAMRDPTVDDAVFIGYIAALEADFKGAGNRARDAMHSALIAIGTRNGRLRLRAVDALRRMGVADSDRAATVAAAGPD